MSDATSVPRWSIRSHMSASADMMDYLSSADVVQLNRPQFGVHGGFRSCDLRSPNPGPLPDLSKVAQDPPAPRSGTQEKRLPNVADWKGTLDLVTGMASVAGDQRSRLQEQTDAQQRALEDLRRELHQTQQRLRASEQRAQELEVQADSRLRRIQADLDVQVEEARAETEARVRVIRAQTAGLIQATEERLHVAGQRAQRAEAWLQRIDVAAKNLLLNGHMNRADNRQGR